MASARRYLLTALVLFLMHSNAASAQTGTIFGFGDSFIDTRRLCTTLAYPGSQGGCSNGLNSVQYLSRSTGYSLNPANIYAVAGAGTGATYPGFALPISTAVQVGEFTQTGQRIGPRDLVLLSGLGNNSFAFLNPAFSLTAEQFATVALQEQRQNLANLIQAGARNVIAYNFAPKQLSVIGSQGFYSGGVWTPLPVPPAAYPFTAAVDAGLGKMLAGFAGSGTQIRFLDFSTIVTRALQTPSVYSSFGILYNTPCLADPSCVVASRSVQNRYFFYDVHPTETGQLIISRYIQNLLSAQDAIPAQIDVVRGASNALTGMLTGRLDAYRNARFGLAYNSMASVQGAVRKAPASEPALPISVYMQASHGNGSRDDTLSASGLLAGGGSYDSTGGTIGIERWITPNLLVGGAFNYAYSGMKQQAHKLETSSYQFAGYASYGARNWFADVVAGYGHHDLRIDRLGVIDTLHARPEAGTISIAAKAGYLVDLESFRAGPIAGLNFVHSRIDGYTESGDSVITQRVNRQDVSSLIGSAGVQVRRAFVVGGAILNPYLNLTVEHEFLDNGRWLITQQMAALDLPIWTPVAGASARTYGKAAGGMSVGLGGGLSTAINASATFGRTGSEQYLVSGGFKYQF